MPASPHLNADLGDYSDGSTGDLSVFEAPQNSSSALVSMAEQTRQVLEWLALRILNERKSHPSAPGSPKAMSVEQIEQAALTIAQSIDDEKIEAFLRSEEQQKIAIELRFAVNQLLRQHDLIIRTRGEMTSIIHTDVEVPLAELNGNAIRRNGRRIMKAWLKAATVKKLTEKDVKAIATMARYAKDEELLEVIFEYSNHPEVVIEMILNQHANHPLRQKAAALVIKHIQEPQWHQYLIELISVSMHEDEQMLTYMQEICEAIKQKKVAAMDYFLDLFDPSRLEKAAKQDAGRRRAAKRREEKADTPEAGLHSYESGDGAFNEKLGSPQKALENFMELDDPSRAQWALGGLMVRIERAGKPAKKEAWVKVGLQIAGKYFLHCPDDAKKFIEEYAEADEIVKYLSAILLPDNSPELSVEMKNWLSKVCGRSLRAKLIKLGVLDKAAQASPSKSKRVRRKEQREGL